MIISLIVAMDTDRGIGKNGRMAWHIGSDLNRFKAITMGHHILMGRKTFEAIGRSLPGRVMIVLTHRKSYRPEGCLVAHSLKSAFTLARKNKEAELFIIGGGDVFSQSIKLADKIYLTSVHTNINADVFFPKIDEAEWEITHKQEISPRDTDQYGSDFKILIRKREKQG